MSDHPLQLDAELNDLLRNMRTEVQGVNGRAYDFWGKETYNIMKDAALAAVEHIWADTRAAAFLAEHGNTREAMLSAISTGNDREALRRVPDLPAELPAPDNLSRPVARAVADRVEASVAAGAVRDTPKVEAYVENLRSAAPPRITQAQRDAARAQSSTSASSVGT